MGWSDCGTDSQGRPIGYAYTAKCDHTTCNTEIDRGLGYACGGMHGEVGVSIGKSSDFYPTCENYFCEEHLVWLEADFDGITTVQRVCMDCYKAIVEHLGIDE